jgi:titin
MPSPDSSRVRLAIEPLEDRLAPAILFVTNTHDTGGGSLRAAITSANALPGADSIRFNIAGEGVHSIDLLSTLPTITDTLKLAGRTQSGFAGSPLIELNGAAAGPGASGLVIAPSASASIVRALAINRFASDGIRITADNCRVLGCRIGTDPAGTRDLGNGVGVRVANGANGNAIGGDRPSERNVISGNFDGVRVEGDGTDGNVVRGNSIGTDATGTFDLGNSGVGVFIGSGASGNEIGGVTAGARNIISGNNGNGVTITGAGTTSNTVKGNYIGTDRTGTADLGNSGKGIMLGNQAAETVIGGTTRGEGNVISGNGATGVWLQGAGTTGNRICGNRIGVSAKSSATLGNGEYGIFIGLNACNNAIGGTGAGAGNVIAHNGMHGVALGAGTGNAIQRNRIFENEFLGIDLDADGVTANDLDDIDSGANTRLNYPELSSVRRTVAGILVNGSVDAQPNQSIRIEIFSTPTLDSGGHGEANRYLGHIVVQSKERDSLHFRVLLPSDADLTGQFITATATDYYGNTSEFSLGLLVR